MLQSDTQGLHVHIGSNGNNIIAAFDLDWTLVRSVKGTFPKDENDWAFLPNRIGVLRYYQDLGSTLVIFTNQGYKGNKLTTAINRINKIIAGLIEQQLNPWVFAATGDGSQYRKPGINMWNKFSQYHPDINLNNSFYVGDAAGRLQDHSSDDINFARNIGVKFYTPEEVFPSTCLRMSNTYCTNYQLQIPDTQTMFIFVGMPGSGKSSFFQQNLLHKGWILVNQDILKTKSKVLSSIHAALSSGKSVAVDATNPSLDKRREYLNIAIQYQIPTMILYFVTNGYQLNKLRPDPVPNVAYSMYYKNLIEPSPELDGVPVVEIS